MKFWSMYKLVAELSKQMVGVKIKEEGQNAVKKLTSRNGNLIHSSA